MDGGAWWATVHWVAKSQTQLSDFTFSFFLSFSLSLSVFLSDITPKNCETMIPGLYSQRL